jgi:acyl carrier protein
MISRAEINTGLEGIIREALNLHDDEDVWGATWAELGAESIDLLDIVFRVEQEFGIKIQRTDLDGWPPSGDSGREPPKMDMDTPVSRFADLVEAKLQNAPQKPHGLPDANAAPQ